MKVLCVNTIYPSFMGEVNVHGIGTPCTFIRLSGCNLRCYKRTKGILCDTPEALEVGNGKKMTIGEIVGQVKSLGRKVVCLTGGEPLLQHDVSELLSELTTMGVHVVVETNGSISVYPYRHIRNVSFVVDVKPTSSGEQNKMLTDNYRLLDEKDFLKFVIDTKGDLDEFMQWVPAYDVRCNIAVGTFWGSEVSYSEIISRLNDAPWKIPIHLNAQTHKMMCLYDSCRDSEVLKGVCVPKEL